MTTKKQKTKPSAAETELKAKYEPTLREQEAEATVAIQTQFRGKLNAYL